MRNFAAPTAKCATSGTIAATNHRWDNCHKKKGRIGIKALTAVDKAPDTAETIALLNPSSVVLRRASALMTMYAARAPIPRQSAPGSTTRGKTTKQLQLTDINLTKNLHTGGILN